MSAPVELAFRRILLAVDGSAECRVRVEVAAGLAASLRATVAGVFVEQEQLLAASQGPLAREVSRRGGPARALERTTLERELRAQAEVARRALESVARRRKVEWSFTTVRGRGEHELAQLAQAADLVAVAGMDDASGAAPALLLHGRRGRHMGPGPVVVADDGGAESRAAVQVATAIARADGRRLRVLRSGVADQGLPSGADAAGVTLIPAGAPVLRRALVDAHAGLIVLAQGCAGLVPADLGALADAAPCPVLLLRPPSPKAP